jgi:hypothetical protein
MLVEIGPFVMCWPVEIENDGSIKGDAAIKEWDPPNTGAFYWGWSHDLGKHRLEHRFIPQKTIIGFSLNKTIEIDLNKTSLSWLDKVPGKSLLNLYYTDEHGIIAVGEIGVKSLL